MKASRSIAGLAIYACCLFSAPAQLQTRPDAQPGGYILGPNDQISVQVIELPEFQARSYRIDSDGTVNLPIAGRVKAGGLTIDQVETELVKKLHEQVLDPHVTVGLVESKSQPVSVLGAVNAPGTQQIEGSKTLFDVIAAAGGLKTDAGDVITITRQKDQGALALPGTHIDPVSGKSTAEVTVADLVELRKPGANIPIQPRDQVFVSTARILYVIGNVRKPGGFTLSGKRPVSALEALSLAEGLSPNAAPGSARILRLQGNDTLTRREIPINLKRVLQGKSEDMQLFPEDILFIPDNSSRKLIGRVAETALATISGIAIWRGF